MQVDFRQFIQVEPVAGKDFRKDKINISDYSAIILNSRNAIDHLFRVCEELRIKLSQDTKFFCISEAVALYLQKYTQYRKRKVFLAPPARRVYLSYLVSIKTMSVFFGLAQTCTKRIFLIF